MIRRYLSTIDVSGWTLKAYGICAGRSGPRGALLTAARRAAVSALPSRPDQEGAFGVGFLIVRDTADTCLALVDWWSHFDELHQRVYAAPPDRPEELTQLSTASIGGSCELAVIAHEQQAWLRHVLCNPAGWDIAGYLADPLRVPADVLVNAA
jgi:hypothetical protein